MQTFCENCLTPQGPFKRMIMTESFKMPITSVLCKNLKDCAERRKKLDRDRWDIKK